MKWSLSRSGASGNLSFTKMRWMALVLLVGFAQAGLVSCYSPPNFSLTPEIEFKDLQYKPAGPGSRDFDTLQVQIYWKDGDGNLGLSPEGEDVLPPFNSGSENYYNIFISIFRKVNNEFVQVQLPSGVQLNGRFPRVHATEDAAALRGEILYNMLSFALFKDLEGETIKLHIQIQDRALNRSNVLVTPEYRMLP
jgi:hypothetical protein